MDGSVKRIIGRLTLLMGAVLIIVLTIHLCSADGECRDATWDGGGADNLATTPANWDLDTAPVTGDNLLFDSTSDKNITLNNLGIVLGTIQVTEDYDGFITLTATNSCYRLITTNNTNIVIGTYELKVYSGYTASPGGSFIRGTFTGTTGKISMVFADANSQIVASYTGVKLHVYLAGAAGASRSLVLASDSSFSNIEISSTHGTHKMIFNTSGYDLVSSGILIGARGVFLNGLEDSSVISTNSFDSTNAAATFTPNGIIMRMTGNGGVHLKAGESIDSLEVSENMLRLYQDTTVNIDLSFIGNTASHPYGLYLNAIRNNSVTTDANGSYSLGSGVFAWDNATLKITPVVTLGDHYIVTAGLKNLQWDDFRYYYDYNSDLDVDWMLVTSADWLSVDSGGVLYGTSEESGNFTYSLTALHDNGESYVVSGYIIVDDSINDFTGRWTEGLFGIMITFLIIGAVWTIKDRIGPRL